MPRFTRRDFLGTSITAAAALSLPVGKVMGANNQVNVGFVGLGGRGQGHCKWFSESAGVKVAALCDPDTKRLGKMQDRYPDARAYTDVRELIDDKDIDAVVIATCNHWHCLAAIWACQAGKDVYVEKPLGHNQFEQRQLVAAARKYNRIVQVGTQQRSDPVQAQIKAFLHDEQALGKVKYVRANRYGLRKSIGKRDTPLKIDSDLNYDLWLGPAGDEPIFRKQLQYDWHWDWNTGNGEMGNWGVHILDDVRNVALQDQCTLPPRMIAGGGRVTLNDAGDTPNVHFVYFDTGTIPVLFDLSNVSVSKGSRRAPNYLTTRSGYTVHCEGGYYSGGRGGGTAFDNNGKVVRKFNGDGGGGHAQNFIDAVRSRKRESLNTEVEVGHHSSGWCNLANVAYRVGGSYSRDRAMEINRDSKAWADLLDGATELLAAHDIDITSQQIALSPVLEFDPQRERFTGPAAQRANGFLTRKYRAPFTVPEKI